MQKKKKNQKQTTTKFHNTQNHSLFSFTKLKKINISEDDIISVEAAMAPQYSFKSIAQSC
jgi:hypothetical protein